MTEWFESTRCLNLENDLSRLPRGNLSQLRGQGELPRLRRTRSPAAWYAIVAAVFALGALLLLAVDRLIYSLLGGWKSSRAHRVADVSRRIHRWVVLPITLALVSMIASVSARDRVQAVPLTRSTAPLLVLQFVGEPIHLAWSGLAPAFGVTPPATLLESEKKRASAKPRPQPVAKGEAYRDRVATLSNKW